MCVCVVRVQACWGVSLWNLNFSSGTGRERAGVCDKREGVDRLHPLCLLQAKSFPPDQEVGGDRTPPLSAAWQEHGQVSRAGPWGWKSCLSELLLQLGSPTGVGP